jgi:hypothetical protein
MPGGHSFTIMQDRGNGKMYFERSYVTSLLVLQKMTSLGDGQCVIKITQCIKRPFLFLNSDKGLFDALEETRSKMQLPHEEKMTNKPVVIFTSRVNSSRFTSIQTGSVMNLLVISRISRGRVAEIKTTFVYMKSDIHMTSISSKCCYFL